VILAFLRLSAWLYYLQPHALRAASGNLLGVALRTAGVRARVIRENLAIAFPGDGEANRARRAELFKAAYRHFGKLVLEISMLLGPMRRYCRAFADLQGIEHWREARQKGRGVLFLSSHVGNWEVMAATGALNGAIDLMLVTKLLKPGWLHRAIEAGRSRCSVLATYEPKTLREALGHLKRGGTVGIVLDQYAGAPVGIRVPFMGVPVGTHSVLAMLAKRTGAAVVPVVNHRLPGGGFRVEIQPSLDWISDDDPTRELALNTARYAKILEEHVYRYPEEWLWTHRRFKGDLSPLRPDEWEHGRSRK
jgi:KDO2-lipid IV(A) lauroyltransferase